MSLAIMVARLISINKMSSDKFHCSLIHRIKINTNENIQLTRLLKVIIVVRQRQRIAENALTNIATNRAITAIRKHFFVSHFIINLRNMQLIFSRGSIKDSHFTILEFAKMVAK